MNLQVAKHTDKMLLLHVEQSSYQGVANLLRAKTLDFSKVFDYAR